MIGADVEVPCLDGRTRRYVDLDYAASTPAMAGVWAAVEEFMPWSSSVHRGSGYKSRLATAAYEGARGVVAEFVGARDGTVVLVRNTTEAINVLSAALPAGSRVLSTAAEHHANMLPWRRHDVTVLPIADSAWELVERCEHALRVAQPRIDLVAVTGASNVTGEVWPLGAIADLAHQHGAQLFVDAGFIFVEPNVRGITPSYEEKRFDDDSKRGQWRLIASGDAREGSVLIHQDADVFVTRPEAGQTLRHDLAPGRRAYVHVVRGEVRVNGRKLSSGDALKVERENLITLDEAREAEVLLFDLP